MCNFKCKSIVIEVNAIVAQFSDTKCVLKSRDQTRNTKHTNEATVYRQTSILITTISHHWVAIHDEHWNHQTRTCGIRTHQTDPSTGTTCTREYLIGGAVLRKPSASNQESYKFLPYCRIFTSVSVQNALQLKWFRSTCFTRGTTLYFGEHAVFVWNNSNLFMYIKHNIQPAYRTYRVMCVCVSIRPEAEAHTPEIVSKRRATISGKQAGNARHPTRHPVSVVVWENYEQSSGITSINIYAFFCVKRPRYDLINTQSNSTT